MKIKTSFNKKLHSLDSRGHTHLILPLVVVAIVAIIGVRLWVTSHATQLHALGAIPPAPNIHQHLIVPPPQQTFSSSINISKWAPPVGDQGQVGSCDAWAIDHSLFAWYANYNGYNDTGVKGAGMMAPMYTYAQISKGQDNGSTPAENFSIAESQGIDTEGDYYQGDYDFTDQPTAAERSNAAQYKITSYYNIFDGLQTGNTAQVLLEQQLASGFPAVITLPVYPEFDNANSSNSLVGTPTAGQTSRGYHEITAFGYNTQGLLVENQWGTYWGNNGWATLSWAFVNQYLVAADAIHGITGTLISPANSTSRLYTNQSLLINQSLVSTNGLYELIMQSDGNLVLYKYTGVGGWAAYWSTGTGGDGSSFLAMQPDGNLVVYKYSGGVTWNSGTYGYGAAWLNMQNDGNLVVYLNNTNVPIWDWAKGILQPR